MRAVDEDDIADQLTELLDLVEAGEAVLIKRGGQAIAKLIPVRPDGSHDLVDDDVAPSDEVEEAFYGD